MRKVLCFSFLSPPTLNAEAIAMAKQLAGVKARCELSLITTIPTSSPRDDILTGYLDGIRVTRLDNRGRLALAPIRAAWKFAGREDEQWAHDAAAAARDEQPDLVWSRFAPGASHVAALRWMHGVKATPWVAQFSDPWAGSPLGVRGVRTQVENRRMRNEWAVCARADAFIFPTTAMADLYIYRYRRLHNRTEVVPHCFDPLAYPARVMDQRARPRLAHVGGFYQREAFDALLGALRGLDVDLRIVGPVPPDWLSSAHELEISCIATGPVTYRDSLREMVDADLLLFVDPLRCVNTLGPNVFLPSKLVDYFGSRRPIFGLVVSGSPADVLMQRFGFPTASNNSEARVCLAAALRDLSSLTEMAAENDYSEFGMSAVGNQLASIVGGLESHRTWRHESPV